MSRAIITFLVAAVLSVVVGVLLALRGLAHDHRRIEELAKAIKAWPPALAMPS